MSCEDITHKKINNIIDIFKIDDESIEEESMNESNDESTNDEPIDESNESTIDDEPIDDESTNESNESTIDKFMNEPIDDSIDDSSTDESINVPINVSIIDNGVNKYIDYINLLKRYKLSKLEFELLDLNSYNSKLIQDIITKAQYFVDKRRSHYELITDEELQTESIQRMDAFIDEYVSLLDKEALNERLKKSFHSMFTNMIQPKPTSLKRYIRLISSDVIKLLESPKYIYELSSSVFYNYLVNDRFRIQCMFDAYSVFILDSIVDESMNHMDIRVAFTEHYMKYKNYITRKRKHA